MPTRTWGLNRTWVHCRTLRGNWCGNPDAADVSRIYNEIAEATSPTTAEVLVHTAVATTRDNLVTEDYLDARLAELDSKNDVRFAELDSKIDTTIERAMRRQIVWLVAAIFASNGLLATWLTGFG